MTNESNNTGEVVSFTKAAEPHAIARAEKKLKKVQTAFKAVRKQKLKEDRISGRKKKNANGKKKRKK